MASSMLLMAWARACTRAGVVRARRWRLLVPRRSRRTLFVVTLRLPHGLDQRLLRICERRVGVLAEPGQGDGVRVAGPSCLSIEVGQPAVAVGHVSAQPVDLVLEGDGRCCVSRLSLPAGDAGGDGTELVGQ